MAASISRSSLYWPEMPSVPDFLFMISSIWAGVRPSRSIKNVTTEGSNPPERVPIIKPSSGVMPMDVSMTLPFLIAAIDEPLPK